MKHFLNCYKKYIDFKTRSTREEFWYFVLFGFVALSVLLALDFLLTTTIKCQNHIIGGWLTYFYALGTLLPFSAVMTRRLHDTGKPEIWMILYYVTVVGLGFGMFKVFTAYANTLSLISLILSIITVFVMVFYLAWLILTLCVDSQKTSNKYGDCPKITPVEEEIEETPIEENTIEETTETTEEPSIKEKIMAEIDKLEDNIK